MRQRQGFWFSLLALWAVVPGLAQAQTRDPCGLLDRQEGWADALKVASQTWRVSPGTLLAVIDQESRFRANAMGAGATGPNGVRNFGFAQANLRTWNWFLRDTGRGSGARTDFALSVQFVGWHFATMERRLGIPRDQTVRHYLVYKMGEGGFRRGASAASRAIATRLSSRAQTHDTALQACGFGPEPGEGREIEEALKGG